MSTTPRPIPLIRDLLKDPATRVTRGSTFDNISNLAPEFLAEMRRQYEGTTIGRQELYADVLDEAKGALWKRNLFRFVKPNEVPQLRKIVIGVDPSITSDGAEAGIVAFGLGVDDFGYILGDHSTRGSPRAWAEKAVEAYKSHTADSIVAEVNQGGEMVREMIRTVDPHVRVVTVHASRGKRTRAEPVVSKYEAGRIKHVGSFPTLEDQLVTWCPDESTQSPDRLDALVWAVTSGMLTGSSGAITIGGSARPSYWRG
jgi:phage terminase large subunit-like protein